MEANELAAKLEEEKDHTAWLEKLLGVLYGTGWKKLTISNAKEWHNKYFASQQVAEDKLAKRCGYFNDNPCLLRLVDCNEDCPRYYRWLNNE